MKRVSNIETPNHVGGKVKVCGWVNVIRSHGKILFIDLRDRTGILQVVFVPPASVETSTFGSTKSAFGQTKSAGKQETALYDLAKELRPEWVVEIMGEVVRRPARMVNSKIPTGYIELSAEELKVLSRAKTLPFAIDTDGYEINEEIRMKYRYLDIRRERMLRNLIMRDKVILFARQFLHERGFIEIETPILTKSTPEGARDFVVPSRLYPGKFYALPQSPQQYKQLLMVAGVEKYFQIARALRDEDTRGDRQPEHTQLDIEMSFVEPEDVMSLVETLMTEMVRKFYPRKKMKTPWPRVSYGETMEKYNSDKPDLRENKNDPDELAFAWIIDFPLFELDKQTKGIQPVHHMFVQPKRESLSFIDTEPLKMISTQYDWVCNGYELASGSIRITNPEFQLKVFKLLGMGEEEAKQKFGHLLEAFEYGVPPHGGIAPGIDRLLMILQNEPNIREVIAFSKTGDGRDLMMNSPSELDKKQLKELNLQITKKKTKNKTKTKK